MTAAVPGWSQTCPPVPTTMLEFVPKRARRTVTKTWAGTVALTRAVNWANRDVVDARSHLRSALETFTDLGAQPLVTRTSQELRASGETARKRDPSTVLQLTPMERTVAQLVSTGLSNKDVAARCWVSPRTVAFHLRSVFAKVGVSSRGELAQLDFG